jgi:hypothetical protein
MPEGPRTPAGIAAWRWPIAFVAVAAFGLVGYLVTLNRIDRAAGRLAAAPADLARGLGEMAKKFLTGDVTHRFLSSLPVNEALGPGRLEVVVATTQEVVTRTDEQRAFWDLLSLGRTEVEVRVPVTWRWYVPLDRPWSATLEDQVLTVIAPAPKPSLPPAIHTDGIERRTQADWLRFDAPVRLAELERELTPLLTARAMDPEHRRAAREPARATIEKFATSWLLRESQDTGPIRAVVVKFEDEAAIADSRDQ